MFHIVESCPLTKLNGSLSRRLHSADEDDVSWHWLASYGSWHVYEKKKTGIVASSWNNNEMLDKLYNGPMQKEQSWDGQRRQWLATYDATIDTRPWQTATGSGSNHGKHSLHLALDVKSQHYVLQQLQQICWYIYDSRPDCVFDILPSSSLLMQDFNMSARFALDLKKRHGFFYHTLHAR